MHRRSFVRSAAAFALAGVALPARAQDAPIRVGCGLADTTAEAYYANDEGLFKSAGLDVTVTPYPSSGHVMTAVAGGALDIGVANTGVVADAIRHEAPFVVIAGGGMYSTKAPNGALCVDKTSTVRTAKDLEGKTIAVPTLKDLTEVIVRSWVDRGGGDATQVKIVEFPMSQMGGALERGTVDAALIAEPWLSIDQGKGARILAYAYDAVAREFMVQLWFSSTPFYRKNPALVKRFAQAIYETARWANAHQAQSAPILARWTHANLATVSAMTRCRYATSLDPKLIDPVLASLYKYKAIDRLVTAQELVQAP